MKSGFFCWKWGVTLTVTKSPQITKRWYNNVFKGLCTLEIPKKSPLREFSEVTKEIPRYVEMRLRHKMRIT